MSVNIAVAALLLAATAQAAPQIPDLKSVTSITEAAKLCELTEAGIDWSEQAPDVAAFRFTAEDMEPPMMKMQLLKACMMTWAYDRNVRFEISMKP